MELKIVSLAVGLVRLTRPAILIALLRSLRDNDQAASQVTDILSIAELGRSDQLDRLKSHIFGGFSPSSPIDPLPTRKPFDNHPVSCFTLHCKVNLP